MATIESLPMDLHVYDKHVFACSLVYLKTQPFLQIHCDSYIENIIAIPFNWYRLLGGIVGLYSSSFLITSQGLKLQTASSRTF